MRSRVLPIVRKEFVHVRRDFRTLIIVIVMPVVMLFLYGYAINLEIQNVEMVVLDRDGSPASRELIRRFEGSRFFTVRRFDGLESELEGFFQGRRARMHLLVPPDFSRGLQRAQTVAVQVLIDASDPNAAQAIRNYAEAVLQEFSVAHGWQAPIRVEPTVWYNPALKSAYFFVPGLAVLILIMISALLTSIAIVREKETGTLEQMLVSPIRPVEIVLGKVIPYALLAFVDLLLILTIAHAVFEVPFVGAPALLLFAAFVFILVGLSIGLLISTQARTQQVAMMAALTSTLLPTVMLSGFIFPLSSLPRVLQVLSHLVPARYFLPVIRGVLLKGNTWTHIAPEIAILAGIAAGLLTLSVARFTTKLEG